MPETHQLCPLASLPENTSRGFSVNTRQDNRQIFIVRRNGKLYGYLNRCPHTGVSLDWQPDQFLDITGKLIQCATHGALFRIEDGLCIHGPCVNQSLQPVPVRVTRGNIEVEL